MSNDNAYSPLNEDSAQIVRDQYWLSKVPDEYKQAVEKNSSEFGVPIATSVKMLLMESGFRPGQVSKTGALGVAQVLPSTGAEMGYSAEQLMNPQVGLRAGIQYLGKQYGKYGNEDQALGAYNMGPGRMDQILAGKAGYTPEGMNYIDKAHKLENEARGYGNPQGDWHSGGIEGNIASLASLADLFKKFSHVENSALPIQSIASSDESLSGPLSSGLLDMTRNFNALDKQRLVQLTQQLEV